jgi:hypothetical protein
MHLRAARGKAMRHTIANAAGAANHQNPLIGEI